MCTTILILGPLVLLLRRRFCNKVEPYVLSCPPPHPSGPWGWGWEGEGWPWGGGSHSSTSVIFTEIFGFLLVLVLWRTPGGICSSWAERSLL